MNRLWKDLRTNMMYWRFRHLTRNRLRLRNWYLRNKPNSRSLRPTQQWRSNQQFRARASASYVEYHSVRRTWIILVVMVALLTAVRIAGENTTLNPALGSILDSLIIVAAIYAALRGI